MENTGSAAHSNACINSLLLQEGGEKRELTEERGTWEGLAWEVFMCRHAKCPSAELGNSRCTPALGTALLLHRVLGDWAAHFHT